jgi:pantothenate kinase
MTDEEITLCEVLYLCIDGKLIDYNLICLFYDKVKNTEMDAYVDWLVNRWSILRKDENHLPKRFEKKYNTIYIEDGFEYMDKSFKQSIINWLSGYNRR